MLLRSKHSGWTWEGRRTPFMGGGGGGPQQVSSTTTTSNIPEYARPYVETMLGATQRQLFETRDVGGTPAQYDAEGRMISAGTPGTTEITGFRPYKPYSTNVSDYFAPFSPLQRQAFTEVSNLRTPGQFGMGTDLAAQSGRGLLGTAAPAQAYGAQGVDIGALGVGASQMGFGAGREFERAATSPGEVARYMSPYMQNVVDFQKAQALRDYQIGMPMLQAQAVGQGAFGGNRMAIQQAEAQRGLLSQLQGIQASGTQKAFEDAQRQQQFRAQLGLQGLGAGYQGLGVGLQGIQSGLQGIGTAQAGYTGATQAGGTLGNIGAQQSQSDLARITLTELLGRQMQGLEQQKINQAIQDYATAQQYPYMQLGMMSNMLRGLPMQSMTTQSYQAAPSYLTQGIGALGTVGGALKAFGAEGGQVKGLAAGGEIKGYAAGKLVDAGSDSGVVRGIQAKLADIANQPDGAQKLQQIAQTSASQEVRAMALQLLRERQIREQAEAQAEQSIAQDQRGLPTPVTERVGLPAAPAGAMDTLSAASGGIVAFAGRDDSLVDEEDMVPYVHMAQKAREAAGVTGAPNQEFKEYLAKQVGALPGMKKSEEGLMMMDYFSRLGTKPGSLLYAAQSAAQESLPGIKSSMDKIKKAEADVMKGQADLAQADRLERLGLAKEAGALREKQLDRAKALEVAKIQANASMAAANRATDLDRTTTAEFNALVAQGADPNSPATMQKARRTAIETTGLALRKVEATESTALANAISKDPEIGEKGALTQELKILKLKKNPSPDEQTKIDNLEDKIAAKRATITNQITRQEARQPAPGAAPAPVQALPMPAKQADLVKGKIYNTARGPAEWNGSAFVPVRQQ